jgi:hypothetical protein
MDEKNAAMQSHSKIDRPIKLDIAPQARGYRGRPLAWIKNPY